MKKKDLDGMAVSRDEVAFAVNTLVQLIEYSSDSGMHGKSLVSLLQQSEVDVVAALVGVQFLREAGYVTILCSREGARYYFTKKYYLERESFWDVMHERISGNGQDVALRFYF